MGRFPPSAGAKAAQKVVQKSILLAQLNGRIEARTKSHPPLDPCNTLGGGRPRETRVSRTVGAPPDSTRGLRAEWQTQPRQPRGESVRAPSHWRCHAGGTRRPPPRSRSPTRSQPPSRK